MRKLVSCMSLSNAATDNSFVVPNSENLKGIGPGCFVRVAHQSQNVWVEITDVVGEQCQGVVIPMAKPEAAAASSVVTNTVVRLQKEQINALGCDRFCYCD